MVFLGEEEKEKKKHQGQPRNSIPAPSREVAASFLEIFFP